MIWVSSKFLGVWQFKGQEYKFLFLCVPFSKNCHLHPHQSSPIPAEAHLVLPTSLTFPVSADALQRLRTHPVAFHPTGLAIKVLFCLFLRLCLTHQTSVSRACFYCLKKYINSQGWGWKKYRIWSTINWQELRCSVKSIFWWSPWWAWCPSQQISACSDWKTEFHKNNASYGMFPQPSKTPWIVREVRRVYWSCAIGGEIQ